ncbi:hypothetical protein DID88_006456 [Monilinia fructigena]|uniref:Uncharacterized protein n=1 Tax=Monilinia fructigena TaxID=38457 RepID=A0A395IGV2_9HELO|nr:hypothetical protein DID88_006456 [Monilinia fructigena]
MPPKRKIVIDIADDSDDAGADAISSKKSKSYTESVGPLSGLEPQISESVTISKEGTKILGKLLKEHEKRDSGIHVLDMIAADDFEGAGISEILVNTCATIASRIQDVFDMLGTMALTCFKMLSEKSLFVPDSPVKNIAMISLRLLDVLGQFEDLGYEYGWQCEITRLCDEAGIDLIQTIGFTNTELRMVKKENIEGWRKAYQRKATECNFAQDEPFNGNGYKYWAKKKRWVPFEDGKLLRLPHWQLGNNEDGKFTRKWFRWDWKIGYRNFSKLYSGGSREYDLTRKEVLDSYPKGDLS